MKRQYIDFVPAAKRSVHKEVKQPVVQTVKVAYIEKNIVKTENVQKKPVEKPMIPQITVEEFLKENNQPLPEYGVVEDYAPIKEQPPVVTPKPPIFKAASVEKRPLSTPRRFISKKVAQDAASAKAEKVSKKPAKPAKKEESFQTPFINRNVEKRPLSKTVYPKNQPDTYEEPSTPVTIINKPEKDANVSLVVAVLLTIILGAAVGTVAFLLLPR